MVAEFAEVCPTRLEALWQLRRRLWRVPGAGLIAGAFDLACAVATLLRRRPTLVYVNSTAAAVYVRAARVARIPSVLHVHESRDVAHRFLERSAPDAYTTCDRVVACSPSVLSDLLDEIGDARVVHLPSVPDERVVRSGAEALPDLVYGPDEIVVGALGTVEYRKGADLWVQVARRVLEATPDLPVRFIWVGAIADLPSGSEDAPVEFVGARANPYPHLRRFDVATLPSRDDPYPLTVVESMLVGTPMVAFAVGGVPDQLGDAGLLVVPGDVAGFARAVERLVRDTDARRELGAAAQRRAEARFGIETFGRTLHRVVEDVLITRRRPLS
jgi:glycosyltransferase involved in cell wall biosynthesis